MYNFDRVFEYADVTVSSEIPVQIARQGLLSAFVKDDLPRANLYSVALPFETEMPEIVHTIRAHIIDLCHPVECLRDEASQDISLD